MKMNVVMCEGCTGENGDRLTGVCMQSGVHGGSSSTDFPRRRGTPWACVDFWDCIFPEGGREGRGGRSGEAKHSTIDFRCKTTRAYSQAPC